MLTSRGWSAYRWSQQIAKRFRSHAAKKGWETRRLMKSFLAQLDVGFKTCDACPATIRANSRDGLCGWCWSKKHAKRRR